MFSGIITEIAQIKEITNSEFGMTLKIDSKKHSKELNIGDSVAINGCCLTVTKIIDSIFVVELVAETIAKTNLKHLTLGAKVNLEISITANQPIGGHLVQGHVSNVAEIILIEEVGRGKLVHFRHPTNLSPYIVNKGYVTIDGMSITVIDVQKDGFSVTFIPHTLENTIAHSYEVGSKVNLEIDIIGKYIEKMSEHKKNHKMPQILEAVRQGKIVIITDHKNREDEGDLVMSAEKVQASSIAFMAKYGSGLICLPMTIERLKKLNIPLMVPHNLNKESHKTAFTVSIDAKHGITTGISAADRAKTIQLSINDNATSEDFIMPGHMFPLQAHEGGVLARQGHTEASVELMTMAGLKPAAVICEIMSEDGSMTRNKALDDFTQRHQLLTISIDEIIEYKKELSKCTT